MTCRKSTALLLLLFWSVWITGKAAGQHPFEEVKVGFDGHFKVGYWTPVEIAIRGPARGVVRIVVPDGDGGPTSLEFRRQQVDVPEGVTRSITTVFRTGRALATLPLQWVVDDAVQATHRVPLDESKVLDATSELFLQVGAPIAISTGLLRARSGSTTAGVTIVPLGEAAQLPVDWLAYDGVDLLVLTTSNEAMSRMDDARVKSLDRWLKLGGRLLWCAGVNAKKFAAAGQPFERFLPGSFVRQDSGWRSTGIETFVAATERLATGIDGRVPSPMCIIKAPRSRVLCWDGQGVANDLPVLVHAPHGLGQILFAAVDLDTAPIRDWDNYSALMGKLLKAIAVMETPVERSKRIVHLGFEDLVGQLRSSLDQFPGVSLVSFSWIIGVVVIYVALIGPGDYLLLRRFGKLQWSWITFPAITLIFVAVTWSMSRKWKSPSVKVNQVDLVDVDMRSQQLRGTTWAHVYSPLADSYDVQLRVQSSSASALGDSVVSWQGLPGDGLGGFRSKNGGQQQRSYAILDLSKSPDSRHFAVRKMPIRHSASRSLSGRWTATADMNDSSELLTDRVRGSLAGTLTNPLDVPLRRCSVLYKRWHYEINTLQPGEQVNVANYRGRRLEYVLTKRALGDQRSNANDWDRLNHDVPRVMEMLMFHRAVGGRGYTGLSHRYQAYVHLSDHLKLGRAILVGQAADPAVGLTLNDDSNRGERQHWVFYRVVFPVDEQR